MKHHALISTPSCTGWEGKDMITERVTKGSIFGVVVTPERQAGFWAAGSVP
jgi:hypothetical protein